MPGVEFDRVLVLYWPTLLPPQRPGGQSVLVYFGRSVASGCESWALVTDVGTTTTVAVRPHGTYARVLGNSKTVQGVLLVYAAGITDTGSPVSAATETSVARLPVQFWPFIVFGSAMPAAGANGLRPALKLVDLEVERRADMQGAPVIIRFKVDANAPQARVVFSPEDIVLVTIFGVLEDVSGGVVSVRVGNLTSTGHAASPRELFSVWSRISTFVNSHVGRIAPSLRFKRESPEFKLFREVYVPPEAKVTAVILAISL